MPVPEPYQGGRHRKQNSWGKLLEVQEALNIALEVLKPRRIYGSQR